MITLCLAATLLWNACGDGSRGAGVVDDRALANARYGSTFIGGGVQLTNGRFEKTYEGSASKLIVTLLEPVARGDLTGDGRVDAAVLLATDPGGSGVFIDLAIVIDDGGVPSNVAALSLGDRVQVQSLDIDGGRIILDMLTHGSDDPMCCPSQKVKRTYRLFGTRLMGSLSGVLTYSERMALPSQAVVTVSLVDVSLQDIAAPAIAEESFTVPGQVPIAFELAYDPNTIDKRHSYAVRARITAGEQLLFTTSTAHPSFTDDALDELEIVLQRVQ